MRNTRGDRERLAGAADDRLLCARRHLSQPCPPGWSWSACLRCSSRPGRRPHRSTGCRPGRRCIARRSDGRASAARRRRWRHGSTAPIPR
ncbi:hypothetical protein AB5I41_07155 [Sphingomonas sp. MMS24-JH45]